MTRKKITIICTSFPPEKGAAPSRMYHLAQMLQTRGHEVRVITSMPNYPTGRIFPGYKRKLIRKESWEGITIYRLWLFPSNSENKYKRLFSAVSQMLSLLVSGLPILLATRPHIVLVSSPPLLSAYTGIALGRLTGARVVLNISDLWPLSALELGVMRKGMMYRMMQHIEKRMYARAHVYSGQSEEILAHVQTLSASEKRSFLYRNLQPVPPFAEAAPAKPEHPRIVYAGLLGVAQGLLDICKAIDFRALGCSLHIYGEGNERERIADFIMRYPDRGIFLYDSIPAAEVPAMLLGYTATLIPLKTNIHGAVPSKIFMSAANRLPILFSGNGEGARIVSSHRIGWVNAAGDFEQLKKNILALRELSETAYSELKNNCLRMLESEFNKDRQDDAFALFLTDIL